MPQVSFFDPALKLCKKNCVVYLDGVPVHNDDNRLSTEGSLLFKQELLNVMQKKNL